MPFRKNLFKLLALISIIFFNLTVCGSELDNLFNRLSKASSGHQKIDVYIDMAKFYADSNFVLTLKYATKANKLAKELEQEEKYVNSLRIMADAYDYLGKYSDAQELNYELLDYYTGKNDIDKLNQIYINVGIVNYYQSNYDQSVEYSTKALKYYESINDSNGVSICYNNIANVHADKLDYKKALVFYYKALNMDLGYGNIAGAALILGNIAETYIELNEYDSAFTQFNVALEYSKEAKDEWQMANLYTGLGKLYNRQNKNKEAFEALNKALKITKKLSAMQEETEVYLQMHELYEKEKDFENSMYYLKLHHELNDSIYNKQTRDKIAELNTLYDIKDKEQQIKDQESNAKFQKAQQIALIVGLLMLIIIVLILVKGNNAKKKRNQQLKGQKLLIETKNRDITDSIEYAQKIQKAILPHNEIIEKQFKDSFLYYQPKDIVAGDFYWLLEKEDSILIAVADCTGHGVPGAMVSVVCSNALNRSVKEYNLTKPSEILDKTTQLVTETFETNYSNIKDGMDIALCKFYKGTNKIEYAGANNPLWIVRDKNLCNTETKLEDDKNKIIEVKANKQPVGKYINSSSFINHKIELLEGDTVYLFTDGYADQFGGPKGKKFKYRALKNLLLEIENQPLNKQKEMLSENFNNWKGDLEQVDDVCVMGIKI